MPALRRLDCQRDALQERSMRGQGPAKSRSEGTMSFKRKLHRNAQKARPLPFLGEEMMCIVCGAVEQSEPNISKGWRCIELDHRSRYYICPREMPSASASKEQWSDAYVRAFDHIVQKTPSGYKPANYVLIFIERDGNVTSARLN